MPDGLHYSRRRGTAFPEELYAAQTPPAIAFWDPMLLTQRRLYGQIGDLIPKIPHIQENLPCKKRFHAAF